MCTETTHIAVPNRQKTVSLHPGPDSKPIKVNASLSLDFNELWLGPLALLSYLKKQKDLFIF